jgi:CRISPR-associated protein Csb1
MNTALNSLDTYLTSNDWLAARNQPVAIVIDTELEPASGADSIVFPPTYARDDKSGVGHPYAIDKLSDADPQLAAQNSEANVCTLDSVGSQANRMEPVFAQEPLQALVPQITLTAGSSEINLLELGHRLADGTLRFSDLADIATQAISAWAKTGNAEIIGKLAPTSLVFGFWDSRESGLKVGRVVSSIIRATNVVPLKRSAQFTASKAVRSEMDKADADGSFSVAENKTGLSETGLLDAPSVDTHGGVRVYGSIKQRVEINLIALRALVVKEDGKTDEAKTLKLRRYILGLSLVAATAQNTFDLRQGCLLVGKEGAPAVSKLAQTDGKRDIFAFTFEEALAFAQVAASDFGVGSSRKGSFEIGRVKAGLEKNTDKKAAKKGVKKAAKTDSGDAL